MRRLIVFRFDRDPIVCRSRIMLLRRLNPGVPIHGLFGGRGGLRRASARLAGPRFLHLDGLYVSPWEGRWNWRHSDLLLASWFRDAGRHLDFDVAHVLEWDLLLLDPLEKAYASIPPDAVALTAPTLIAEIEREWDWLRTPTARREYAALLDHAGTPDGTVQRLACWVGGASLPRAVLQRYAAIDPPELCHDELRLPLFAQALGFPVADTGFRRRFTGGDDDRYFNALSREIPRETIVSELAKTDGRRAFHPVRSGFRLPGSGPAR